MIKRFFSASAVLVVAILIMVSFMACEGPQPVSGLRVVASFYPLYELVQKIGGDKVSVQNMVPAGSEPHDYDPTPKDIVNLNEANLVVIDGGGLEPWAERTVPDLQKSGVKILVVSDKLNGMVSGDPHFWLDPIKYLDAAKIVKENLVQIDPKDAKYFTDNLAAFSDKLTALDQNFQTDLKNCQSRQVVTSHEAFDYLGRRYKLEMIPITGFSPESEPSAQKIAQVVELVKSKGIKYIFSETLLSPKIAQTLATEANVQNMVLNPLEGLTQGEISAGADYISVMKVNLENLKTGLGCS